jgi:hypothetical protein
MSWKGLTEAFACSTGVGIAGIQAFHLGPQRLELPAKTPVSDRLRKLLEDQQFGHAEDTQGWRLAV